MLQKENNPWLGLASYTINDAYRFFGREQEMEVLKDAVCNNYITTIYGISGAGKTSLINAGMTPLLSSGAYLPVNIRLEHGSCVGYGRQIISAIRKAVSDSGGEIELTTNLNTDEISDSESLWAFLYTSTIWSATNHQVCPIIFIDQFEELFTKNEESEAITDFFNIVSTLQNNTPPEQMATLLEAQQDYVQLKDEAQYRLVLIMREDFLARLEDYSYNIPMLRKNRQGIRRMNGLQALDVVLRPMPDIVSRNVALQILSKVTGHEVQDKALFLERLSVDTSILSLFCSELYLRAAEIKADTISEELVNQFGGNIISTFYENTMKLVSTHTMEYLEDQLLTKSGFRDTVAWDDMKADGIKREELTTLADKRLIRIENHEGLERVEFTHDVLCQVAKDHRDRRNEKSVRNGKRLRHFQFAIESTFVTSLPLMLLYNSYYHDMTGQFKRPVLWFLLAFILFLGMVVSPYRHTKDKNAIWTTVIAWIGQFIVVGFLSNSRYSNLIDQFILYFIIYFIYQVLFLGTWRHRKLRSRREAMKYCLHCKVYNEYPFFKRWTAGLGIVVILAIAHLVGMPLKDGLSFVAGIVLSVGALWLIPHCLPPYNMKWGWSPRYWWLMLAAVVLILAMQYNPIGGGVFMLAIFMVVFFILMLPYLYRLNRENLKLNPQYKQKPGIWALLRTSLISLILYEVLSMSMGHEHMAYSFYNEWNSARVWGKTINNHRPHEFERLLTVRNIKGQQGVVDRSFRIVIPIEYDSIDLFSRYDETDPYGILQTKLFTYRGGEKVLWDCADHLDIQNHVTTALLKHIKDSSEEAEDSYFTEKYFRYLLATLPPDLAQQKIENLLGKKVSLLLEAGNMSTLRRSIANQDYDRVASAVSKLSPLFPYDHKERVTSFLLDTLIVRCSNSPKQNSEDYSSHLSNLAYYKVLTRHYNEAIALSEKALKNDSTKTIAYTNLITALYLSGQYDKAMEMLEAKKEFIYNVSSNSLAGQQFVGSGVWKDLCLYKRNGILTDTLTANYKRLERLLDDFIKLPDYTNIDRIKSKNKKQIYILNKNEVIQEWDDQKEEIVDIRYTLYGLYLNGLKPLTLVYSRISVNDDNTCAVIINKENYKRQLMIFDNDSLRLLTGEYDKAWHFSEGVAAVVINDTIGFINKQGQWVLPPTFPLVAKLSSRNPNYYDCEYNDSLGIPDYVDIVFHDGYCPMVASPGRHGLINRQGQWVVSPDYEYISHPLMGYRTVKKDGHYGLMDRQLKIALPIVFSDITLDKSDNSIALNGRWIYIRELPRLVNVMNKLNDDDIENFLETFAKHRTFSSDF